MRLQVKNLGKIREADVEIRPFTVFIGENNTNKTWLTYLLYGTFDDQNIANFASEKYEKYINPSFFEQVFGTGFASFDIQTIDLQSFVTDLCLFFIQNSAKAFFGIDEDIFADSKWDIILTEKDKENIWNSILDREIKQNQAIANLMVDKNYDSLMLSFTWTYPLKKEIQNTKNANHKAFKDFFARQILMPIGRFILHFFHLPAERAALTAFYNRITNSNYDSYLKTLMQFKVEKAYEIATELAQNTQRNQYPKPIQNFLDFLQQAEQFNNNNSNPFGFDMRRIMGISIGFKEGINKRLGYRTEKHFLELFSGSSMLKSLSSLYLYFKNFTFTFDTLIIDEPEMNLHPQAIVQVTELLASFANTMIEEGSKSEGNNPFSVIINTHSPYIIDHLVNLMEAANLTAEEQEKYKDLFFLKDKNAFISSEKVSVYLFENQEDGTVEVKNILDRENNSINWETFSNVSEKVANIYYQLPTKTH